MMMNLFPLSRCYNSRIRVTHVASTPLSTMSRSFTPPCAKCERLLRSSTVRSLPSGKHSQRRETRPEGTKGALGGSAYQQLSRKEGLVLTFLQACFRGERKKVTLLGGETKGGGRRGRKSREKVALEDLFQYYKLYCRMCRVNATFMLTKKPFSGAVKDVLALIQLEDDDWKEVGFRRDRNSMVVINLVPTPHTENIFLQLREEVKRGNLRDVYPPKIFRTLEPAHFEEEEKWTPPRPVSLTYGPTMGFIGLGVPMTLNLLKAGANVTVWDRSPRETSDVQAAGAKVAGSLEELAKESQVIFGMLADPAAALDVAQQLSKALTPGAIYVDVSTVDASTAQQVAKLVRGAGGRYLKASVSGNKGAAEQGNLIFQTCGDRDALHAVSPMLDVMGKANVFFGEGLEAPAVEILGTCRASFHAV